MWRNVRLAQSIQDTREYFRRSLPGFARHGHPGVDRIAAAPQVELDGAYHRVRSGNLGGNSNTALGCTFRGISISVSGENRR